MRKYIAIDTSAKSYLSNNVLNISNAEKYPGAILWVELLIAAKKIGIEVVTVDIIELRKIDPKDVYLVTEQWSSYTAKMIIKGSYPLLVLSYEAPWHAHRFYINVNIVSKIFENVWVFNGANKWLVGKNKNANQAYFPMGNKKCANFGKCKWTEKNLVVMVNSALPPPRKPKGRNIIAREISNIHSYYGRRIDLVEYFSNYNDFDLYGRGWDCDHKWMSVDLKLATLKSYRGACDDKLEILSKYKFCLCLENSAFGGYITEKIFDCFLSGCIPIYGGPPDINNYIPANSYIDINAFHNNSQLLKFMKLLSEENAKKYINAAQDFLNSNRAENFRAEKLAENIIMLVRNAHEGNGLLRDILIKTHARVMQFKYSYIIILFNLYLTLKSFFKRRCIN